MNAKKVLCKCGHPLGHHALNMGECYASISRRESKKNYSKQDVRVECIYKCICKKFEKSLEEMKCANCGENKFEHIDYFGTAKKNVCPHRKSMKFKAEDEVEEGK